MQIKATGILILGILLLGLKTQAQMPKRLPQKTGASQSMQKVSQPETTASSDSFGNQNNFVVRLKPNTGNFNYEKTLRGQKRSVASKASKPKKIKTAKSFSKISKKIARKER